MIPDPDVGRRESRVLLMSSKTTGRLGALISFSSYRSVKTMCCEDVSCECPGIVSIFGSRYPQVPTRVYWVLAGDPGVLSLAYLLWLWNRGYLDGQGRHVKCAFVDGTIKMFHVGQSVSYYTLNN